jgi:hypothetical protein
LALNGIDYARRLSLSVEDNDEDVALVAKGMALARRAQVLKDAV